MKIYSINYDLRKHRDYDSLYQAIKSYGTYAHVLESVWMIVTERTSAQIRDHLKQYMDRDDGLMVSQSTGEAAWMNLSDDVSRWLKQSLAA